MESSIEVSKTGGTSNPKPSLAPKPRLAPKPFSLQKNTAIRSIHAPKPVVPSSQTTKQQTGKSEATGLPKPTVTTPAKKLPQQTTSSESKPSPVSVLTKAQPNTTKESKTSPRGEDTLDSSVGKSDPASQTTPPKETPKSKPVQKDDVIQANHRASTDIVTKPQDKGEKKNDENHTPVIQNVEEPRSDVSSTHGQESRWGGSRKRLSMELTSKFESAGLSLPSQPTVNTSTTTTKNDANKPRPSDPEPSQTAAEPPDRETDEGTVKEDYTGGSSIKRRISLLFDSSSRPEAMTKREEPEIINGTEGVKGVKERIKNWVTETTPEDTKTERRPQVAPRPCSKSFEPATAPKAEETPQMPPVEPPATLTSRSQAVDLPSKVSSVEQPTETPMEIPEITLIEVKSSESSSKTSGKHVPNESTEGDVQLRKRSSSMPHTSTDEADSARCALKRDSAKRRSVHFGVVVRDDGGPPLILGSASDSSEEEEEEEEASGDEAEEDNVSVPVHRGVAGLLKRNDDEAREQEEQLKHLEFEKRRRAEENEQARLKLEEERKQKEEEEREKEKARQREEEERERERLKAEEMERRRKEEWERECLEEARERQREEMERKRQLELMLQRQREEEQERARQKEERLKRDQEEREKERLKEEERLREERGRQRQREEMERERQLELMLQRQREEERERAKQKEERLREEEERLREEEKRLIHDHEEHRSEGKPIERRYSRAKKREEEWEKEWMKQTETLGGEEEKEREKELELMWQRKTEEDRERARQVEERLRQEEREKERLREEEMERERERQRRLKELQEREKEMERMRQIEMERRSEEERREEERKRQIEKERVEELERKMREELDRKRAQELEEKLQMEEERKRKESAVDEAEPKLISFDSDDVSQKSDSPYPSLVKTREPPESQIKVVYDDFSVKPSVMEVDFDDFSVKPIRWGSQAKAEASPLIQSWEPASDKKEVEAWSPLEVRPWEFKEPEKVEKPHIPELTLPQENPVKEEEEQRPEVAQFISMEVEQEQEKERVEEEETREEVEEEDKQEAPVNSYSTNAGDNDALIDNEPGQQNEACESETDSPKLDHDHVPEVSVVDVDTTDSHQEPELPPFPESSTPLLDTSAQRSKADLGRRRSRSRPSRALLGGLSPLDSADWRTSDSTDKKETSSKEKESDSEDEQPKAKIVCSPPTTSQRVPMFPGLSPAALLAQIKKKTGGGGEETEEDKGREEKESHNVEAAPSPSQLSRSPRNAAHLAGAARVLPPIGGTDGGAASSPAWLKELKSKKRMSQFDGEA
ncbi:182 kDa tankyrase-1-binding protein isoform X2 [Plectropomus leopardus]|uniref:182 kDa tankyrase-1-binding protein isoform X2 n=1 Tax=Plectropomus leopardus TaxID=160734 RepID=UPI001C4C3A08|nr:182 kDa tankyrase-1-binding protein isoform X2 [Plectropomus leopardus]